VDTFRQLLRENGVEFLGANVLEKEQRCAMDAARKRTAGIPPGAAAASPRYSRTVRAGVPEVH